MKLLDILPFTLLQAYAVLRASGYTLIWETCILLKVYPGDFVGKIFLFNELKKLQCRS